MLPLELRIRGVEVGNRHHMELNNRIDFKCTVYSKPTG